MKTAGADALLRYRVLRPLGATRFGHAQLALLEGEDRSRGFFALELLREDWARDPELRSSFLDEAAHTLSFEHPNVVRTQEVLAAPEVCGRVTRWFAGQSLATVLERVGRAQFPLHLHVRVLCEVLAAVQYLHELEQAAGGRLVYRDTAPAHVLVTYTGQIKIVGAGFERTIDEIERRSGVLFSDIDYASPELCLGYPAAPSADVYSVGVMLWEALARARRVFADTAEAKVRMRINGEEPDVDQFKRGVPERLAQICRRALAVSPRDRYPSAQELQIDLESFLADTETDAQQNAGLGALAELMGQHFAAERAEMLGYIEQQLAEPEAEASPLVAMAAASPPASQPASAQPAGAQAATVTLASAGSVARSRATAPRLELAADDLDDLDEDVAEGPTELLAALEPARWDEHTHTVTSFEELGPVDPPPESLREQLLASEALPPSSEPSFSSLPPASMLDGGLAELGAGAGSQPALREDLPADEVAPGELLPEPVLPEEPVLHEVARAQTIAFPPVGPHPPPPPSSASLSSSPAAVPPAAVPPGAVPQQGPRLLQVPAREPDTSGHRAYTSSLRALPASSRDWLRTAAPVGLAAALVLLVGYGVRVARSSASASAQQGASAEPAQPAASAGVSNAELRLQAAPAAPEVVEIVHPSALAVVAPADAPELPAAAAGAGDPAEGVDNGSADDGDIVELVEQGAAAAPAAQMEPALTTGGPFAAAGEAAIPVVAGDRLEPELAGESARPSGGPAAATREEDELEPPPLVVEELLNGEERRPPPRARRSRARSADSRAARSGAPQPRAIDETDPYLD